MVLQYRIPFLHSQSFTLIFLYTVELQELHNFEIDAGNGFLEGYANLSFPAQQHFCLGIKITQH